jgi:hypothetical protein
MEAAASPVFDVQITRRNAGNRPAPPQSKSESTLERWSRVSSTAEERVGRLESHPQDLIPRPAIKAATRRQETSSRHQHHANVSSEQPSHPRGDHGIVVAPVTEARSVDAFPPYILPTSAPEQRRKLLAKENQKSLHSRRTLMHDLLTPHRSYVFAARNPASALDREVRRAHRVLAAAESGAEDAPRVRVRDTAERQVARRNRAVAAWQRKANAAARPHNALAPEDPTRSFHRSTIQWYLGGGDPDAGRGADATVHLDLCAPFRDPRRPLPQPTRFFTPEPHPRARSPTGSSSPWQRGPLASRPGTGASLLAAVHGATARSEAPLLPLAKIAPSPGHSPPARGGAAPLCAGLRTEEALPAASSGGGSPLAPPPTAVSRHTSAGAGGAGAGGAGAGGAGAGGAGAGGAGAGGAGAGSARLAVRELAAFEELVARAAGRLGAAHALPASCAPLPPPPPRPSRTDTSRPSSRTNWTRLVHPSVLIGHVSSLTRGAAGRCTRTPSPRPSARCGAGATARVPRCTRARRARRCR